MIKLRKGRDVRLKTGGPRMTVEEILPNGKVVCRYIYNFIDVRKEVFLAERLEPAERFRFYPEELVD